MYHFVRAEFDSCSEVNNLYLIVLVVALEHDVLWLDVSVHYVLGMTISNRRQHLLHKHSCVFFTKMPTLDYFIKQLPSFDTILHYVKTFRIFKVLVNFYYIGMIDCFKNVYLIKHCLKFRLVHTLFFEDFYGSFLVAFTMSTLADFTKCTFT